MFIDSWLLSVQLDSAVMLALPRSYLIAHNRVTPTTAATLKHLTPVSKVTHSLYLLTPCTDDATSSETKC